MANNEMNVLKVGNSEFEIADAQARQDVSNLKDDLTAAQVELAKKANTDGYYEEMTVGNAEQLVSTVTNADDTPYNFRTTAGSADVGDRAYVDAIVGGTLNVNQLVENGNFASASGWSVYNSTYSEISIADGICNHTIKQVPSSSERYLAMVKRNPDNNFAVANHKYLISCEINSCKAMTFAVAMNASETYEPIAISVPDVWVQTNRITIAGRSLGYFGIYPHGTNNVEIGDVYKYRNAQITDLTQDFGTAIADYVYSLEQATSGAGVAWLKANAPKIFDGGYIPFNAGTLQSVVGLSEKRNTGLNQWDEEWENGSIDASGNNDPDPSRIRSKNYIAVLPNTNYYFNALYTLGVRWYAEDKSFISGTSISASSTNKVMESPSNAYYLRFSVVGTTTYNNDICINLHWDGEKDGTYEPYTVHTYAFDPTVELRGVPKLKDGKMYFDGDEYLPDGTVNRRYAEIIFDGSDDETITAGTSGMTFRIYLPSDAIINTDSSEMTNTFATYLTQVTQQSTWGKEWTFCRTANQRSVYFKLADDLTDISTLRTYLAQHPLIFVYELATPTTETAEPYNPVEIVDDFGTEEFITTSLVPVGHETRYAPNLRAKLEMSPDSPDGDGLYIVQQSSGENTYIPLASSATIQSILARLTALEGNTNEG